MFTLTLSDLLAQAGFITHELAVLGLLITAAIIVLARDWRLTLVALVVQYLFSGLLLSRLVTPEIALVKVFIGALICTMLYLAARQAGESGFRPAVRRAWGPLRLGSAQTSKPRESLSFRVLALTLVLLLVVVTNQSYPLPSVSPDISLGSYWLMFVGILILMLTDKPLKAGPGLLTLIMGFELLYAPLERSLTIVWLWSAANLLLATAMAYIIVVRATGAMEDQQ